MRNMEHDFIVDKYVVAWAGCKVPIESRTFKYLLEAYKYYERKTSLPYVRIEEVSIRVRTVRSEK